MINKCFVTKLTSPMENNSEEYLYSGKLTFNNTGDGEFTMYVNRAVNVQDEIINNTDKTVTYAYSSSAGHTLKFPNKITGTVIIKDMRTLFVRGGIVSNGRFPSRNMTFDTAMYANVNEQTAAAFSYNIQVYTQIVTGNIVDFSKFIALSTLTLAHATNTDVTPSKVEGSLESLAEGMISFGRTSGTLTVYCNGVVTVNGTAPAARTAKTITFNEGTYSIT